MKKRLKGLLALMLALCMVLTMGVGLVSAATPTPVDVGTIDSLESAVVETDTILYAKISGNRLLVRYDGTYETPPAGTGGSDLYIGKPTDSEGSSDDFSELKQEYTYFITSSDGFSGPKVKTVDELGYVKNKWKLESPDANPAPGSDVEYCWLDSEDSKYWLVPFGGTENVYTGNNVCDGKGDGSLDLASLTKIPIAYTVKYVNEKDTPLTTPGAHFAIAPTDKFDDKTGGKSGEEIPETPEVAENIASEEDLKKNGDEAAIKVGQIKDEQILVWEAVEGSTKYYINPGTALSNMADEINNIKWYTRLAKCSEAIEDISSWNSDNTVYEKKEEEGVLKDTINVAWVKQNITLKAKWKYGIKYEGAGGADKYGKTMSQVPFDLKDIPTSFAANMFTNEGKAFAGWNIQADGKGQSFAAGEAISQSLKDQIEKDGSITLYATWKDASGGAAPGGEGEPPEAEKPYTLKYNANKSKTGLKGSIPSQKFYESADNTTSVDENMYIKPIDSFDNADQPGYSFTWNTKANGKGKTIKEWSDIEDVEDTLIKAADKNNVITLYAQRTMNTYKINYFDGDPDDPDTEPIDEQKITAEDVDEDRLPDADDDRIKERKPGYILKGWKYIDRETGEEIIFEPGQKIDKDMFADIAAFEGMELYAVWEKLDGASGTGDSSNILPWLILATAAALGAVAMTTRKRTEK